MNLRKNISHATKWSALSELCAKIVNPLTSMVLARLLCPDEFGIVATIMMVVVFAEIFTDAGFQKYIIQHEFKDEESLFQSTNIAFWTNFTLSIIIWAIIWIFDDSIANLVGNPGLGFAITIASIAIPLEALSSIQMALYKRNFDFKTLFKARIVGILVPLFVTIPLAFYFRSFWAIIAGTLFTNLVNAIILTVNSSWKPQFFYSIEILRKMFSFSLWSMIEALSVWFTNYIDIFIIGVVLNQYYVGLYKTSITLVGQITTVVTSITTPVLFSALSRLQTDKKSFEDLFFKFLKLVGIIIVPMGVGIYCYRQFVTTVLLGKDWSEASLFIGLWGLTSSVTIVLAHYSSEVYRSLGKPVLSVIAQWLHIVVLVPIIYWGVFQTFDILCVCRAAARLQLVLVQIVFMYIFIRISPIKMVKAIIPASICSMPFFVISEVSVSISSSVWMNVLSIFVCIIAYFVTICAFREERSVVRKVICSVLKNIAIK